MSASLHCPHGAQRGKSVFISSHSYWSRVAPGRVHCLACTSRFARPGARISDCSVGIPLKASQEAPRAETKRATKARLWDYTCSQQVAAVRAEQKYAEGTWDKRKDT